MTEDSVAKAPTNTSRLAVLSPENTAPNAAPICAPSVLIGSIASPSLIMFCLLRSVALVYSVDQKATPLVAFDVAS